MPNLFEDEFTGRLDLSSEETAMYLYDVRPGDWLPYHYEYVEECFKRSAAVSREAAV